MELTKTPLSTLLNAYVKKGVPVLLWASIEMRKPTPGTKWTVTDSGEEFTWLRQEHCMVLVGRDEDTVYFNDPYDNNGVIGYDRALVEQRYEEMGSQAVAVMTL